MSGIPRSKSCLSCQRRKRKCDRRTPVCSYCMRNDDVCSYKRHPQVFFVSGTGVTKAVQHLTGKSCTQPHKVPHTCPVIQPPPLSRTALELQLHHVFWSHYLPHDTCRSMSPPNLKITSKLAHLEYLTSTQPMVRRALDACALTFLGRLHDDPNLARYGMQVYGRALGSVQNAIKSLDYANLDNVVASCRLLSLYEMVRPNEDPLTPHARDWRRHAQATCRLLEVYKCSSSTSTPETPHMQEMRLLAIRLNLLLRNPEYLSRSRWSTPKDHASPDDLDSMLHDLMMSTLPMLLKQSDEIMTKLNGTADDSDLEQQCQALVARYSSLAHALQRWETKMLEKLCMDELIPSDASIGLSDFIPSKIGPVPRSLQTYEQALVINQYWASCLLLFSQALKVTSRIGAVFPSQTTLTPFPTWMDPWPYATKIALSASRLLSVEAGLWVSEQSGFPLGCALHFFAAFDATQTAEMQMLRAAIRRPRLSALTNDFLKSIVTEAVPPEARGNMDSDEEHSRMVKQWYGPG